MNRDLLPSGADGEDTCCTLALVRLVSSDLLSLAMDRDSLSFGIDGEGTCCTLALVRLGSSD